MLCSRLDTFVNDGSGFCQAMGYEVEGGGGGGGGGGEGDKGKEEKKRSNNIQCFDGTIPKTEGVAERTKDDPLSDLFKKYRSSKGGRAAASAADSFFDALDSTPRWILVASALLIGGLLAGRILLFGYGGPSGRRLGGGRSDDFE